jgi:hypothetical protein
MEEQAPPVPFQENPDAKWRAMYAHARELSPGDTYTYADMAEAAGVELVTDRDLYRVRSLWRRAAQELLEIDQRAVKVVRGVGYRIVNASAHIDIAVTGRARASRALNRANEVVTHVRRDELPPAMLPVVNALQASLAAQIEFAKRTEARATRLERVQDLLVERSEASQEELADMRRRLAALEASRAPSPDDSGGGGGAA